MSCATPCRTTGSNGVTDHFMGELASKLPCQMPISSAPRNDCKSCAASDPAYAMSSGAYGLNSTETSDTMGWPLWPLKPALRVPGPTTSSHGTLTSYVQLGPPAAHAALRRALQYSTWVWRSAPSTSNATGISSGQSAPAAAEPASLKRAAGRSGTLGASNRSDSSCRCCRLSWASRCCWRARRFLARASTASAVSSFDRTALRRPAPRSVTSTPCCRSSWRPTQPRQPLILASTALLRLRQKVMFAIQPLHLLEPGSAQKRCVSRTTAGMSTGRPHSMLMLFASALSAAARAPHASALAASTSHASLSGISQTLPLSSASCNLWAEARSGLYTPGAWPGSVGRYTTAGLFVGAPRTACAAAASEADELESAVTTPALATRRTCSSKVEQRRRYRCIAFAGYSSTRCCWANWAGASPQCTTSAPEGLGTGAGVGSSVICGVVVVPAGMGGGVGTGAAPPGGAQ
mmetsp:Transcript_76035/g.198311  ORF Transcript_76035/g.198311 Transcript_76035/m.198311 type:complete len:463 (+) Transcript_76035:1210-2598(+)